MVLTVICHMALPAQSGAAGYEDAGTRGIVYAVLLLKQIHTSVIMIFAAACTTQVMGL